MVLLLGFKDVLVFVLFSLAFKALKELFIRSPENVSVNRSRLL